MEINLTLGGIRFRFLSEREIGVEDNLQPFLTAGDGEPDQQIRISWDWDGAPQPSGPMNGQDALQNYFLENNRCFCMTRGGPKGYVAGTVYSPDFSRMVCTLNTRPFLCPPRMLGSILRFLPMRAMFQHFGVLFFHAAQISLGGTGILFTAPSGTGKTTQARLWEAYKNARIICNDRTLVRQTKAAWLTYGYPIDGSEPVCSSEICRLGCLVLLEQGPQNRVERLKISKALPRLMPQLVIDGWNPAARQRGAEQLLGLLAGIPAYLLTCTPDQEAVSCLEQRLISDGVIQNEDNS